MFQMTSKSLFVVICLQGYYCSCIGFDNEISSNLQKKEAVCQTEVCKDAAQTLLDSIDKSINPCEDFYAFACNKFIAKHPSSVNKPAVASFLTLNRKLTKIIKDILETPNANDFLEMTKAKDMYAQCMKKEDNVEIMKKELNKLGGWPVSSYDKTQSNNIIPLESLLAKTAKKGLHAIVSTFVEPDLKNGFANILTLDQGKLPLGRELLLNKMKHKRLIKHYRKFIVTSIKTLCPKQQPSIHIDKDVDDIIVFETKLAKLTSLKSRANYTKIYHKFTIRELQEQTDPSGTTLNWNVYLNELLSLKLKHSEPIMFFDLIYLKKVVQLIRETKKSVVVNYIIWTFVKSYSFHVGGQLLRANLEFKRLQTGKTKLEDRWFSCATTVKDVWGFAISRPYVEKHFSQDNKHNAEELVHSIRNVFLKQLGEVSFFDEKTKMLAKQKAAAMYDLIGYPDWIYNDKDQHKHYIDYPAMTSAHLTNVMNAVTSATVKQLKFLRKPVFKGGFALAPIEVNGRYALTANSLTVTAGILQPPFFQLGRPYSLNYGAIGSVFGHEMTHGFDDEGRQIDLNGNVVEWWPKKSIDSFMRASKCFINQYNKYCPSELAKTTKRCLNGKLTEGENIADNGGIEHSFLAYKAWLAANGPEKKLPGLEEFSSEKLFYLGFASMYCSTYKPKFLDLLIQHDPHSPGKYRVIGTMSNSKHFAKTFGCSKGPMNRGKDRCVLW